MSARQLTLNLLMRFEKSHAYSNLLLESELSKSDLNAQDRAFATALFYGVIEQRIFCDYQLSVHLSKPLKKLKPEVLTVLRMGVYQLCFMDAVPSSAAINESVKLVKKNKCAYAAGLVNACLRNIDRQGVQLPPEDAQNYYSIRYSVPQNLIDLWVQDYGFENTKAFLEALSEKPRTVIRVNTLLTDTDTLCKLLSESGIAAQKHAWLENALVLEKGGDISALEAFRQGLFHVEDTAAQQAALLLEAQEGERVLDTCAAPGGKSFTIAEEMKRGEIYACDLYENRVGLIRSGANRLHIDYIHPCVQDATEYNESFGLFDRVLCDVPCSGLGIVRRKPEIRYKSAEEIEVFPPIQLSILENSFRYLKQGGTLVYATCTLHKAENEGVIESFLLRHADTAKTIFQKTFMPHIDKTDGFFVAVMKKL